jgi:hypothetical protein
MRARFADRGSEPMIGLQQAGRLTLAAVIFAMGSAPAPFPALPSWGAEPIAAAVMLAAGFVLTPMLALTLLGTFFFQMLGGSAVWVGTVLMLAGVAAMTLRSIDWTPGNDAHSSLRLSPTLGLVAVAMVLGSIALTLALRPAIESLLVAFLG